MIGKMVKYKTSCMKAETWYGMIVDITKCGNYLIRWIKWDNVNMLKSIIKNHNYQMDRRVVEIL